MPESTRCADSSSLGPPAEANGTRAPVVGRNANAPQGDQQHHRSEGKKAVAIGPVRHRFADQIGLTPAGLRENGWAIAKDELDDRRPEVRPAVRVSSRSRLKVVGRGGA